MVIILNRVRVFFLQAWALLSRVTSLRFKLFLSYFFVGLVPLLLFAGVISNTIESYFIGERSKELSNNANQISTTIADAGYLFEDSKRPRYNQEIADRSIEFNVRIIVTDARGVVSNDSFETELGKLYLIPGIMDALDKKNSPIPRVSADKESMSVTVPIIEQNKVVGTVTVSASIANLKNMLNDIGGNLLPITVILGLTVGILVFFISQLLIKPLKNILSAVNKITDGHLDERVVITGRDEFAELGHAFNDMTLKLEKVEFTRQEFVSNVSHELKTPLSSIKVLSESLLFQEDAPVEMYREFLTDICSEVDRMTDIVNELLALVRLDQTEQPLNITTFKVNKLIEDILRRLYPLAEQKDIELLYDDVRPVSVEADEMKMSLAISNLIENGIKYTPGGGTVKVTVDCDHQNAFITVQDTGVGISEEEQPKVFSRFYRVDKTRDRQTGGTGLGLAITHKTVLLHNGSIKLMSKENEGSTFVVRIPLHYNPLSRG